jgi:predicted DNA-binding transcriptional regulator AlpA
MHEEPGDADLAPHQPGGGDLCQRCTPGADLRDAPSRPKDHTKCTRFRRGAPPNLSTVVGSAAVGRHIDTDDVIDAQGMAELLGLAQRNTVSLYQRRYPSMPRPVIDLGQGRCKLWLRSEVEDWRAKRPNQPDPA